MLENSQRIELSEPPLRHTGYDWALADVVQSKTAPKTSRAAEKNNPRCIPLFIFISVFLQSICHAHSRVDFETRLPMLISRVLIWVRAFEKR
jgi:hypothetical protein